MNLHFHSQVVIARTEMLTNIYKLTHGTAELLGPSDQLIATVTAPYYLNLVEAIYSVPTLKTVKSIGRCNVQKTKVNSSHRGMIKKWKDEGLRKSKFHIFEGMQPAFFYELIRFGSMLDLRKEQCLRVKQNHLYLIVAGGLIVSGPERTLKLLKLQEGEVLSSSNSNTYVHASTESLKLLSINLDIVKIILGQQFAAISSFLLIQQTSILQFQTRNNQLSHHIKKSREKLLATVKIPKQFVNKVEDKAKNFDQYTRAKSCFSTLVVKSKKEILSENQARFKELLELNRKKYGQDYIYHKRMEVSRKVNSISCINTPTQDKINRQSPSNQISSSIYKASSMKQQYGILLSHPMVDQWRHMKSSGKNELRKVGRDPKDRSTFVEGHRMQYSQIFTGN